MKIVFLCGYFSKENEKEVVENTKTTVEYSANLFQEKIIEGLQILHYDYQVVSAPFVGSYPKAYKKIRFNGFDHNQQNCRYVKFNNIWGIRNFSRAHSLKIALSDFIKETDKQKLIIVYSPHTPFLEAAVYAKMHDSNIKICLIVPDLPQYMNLNAKKSLLYRIGKKIDIQEFNRLNKYVDSYVLLTEAMKEKIKTQNKPYFVAEGIISDSQLETLKNKTDLPEKDKAYKYIVYTGKMYEKFGVKDLLNAFENISDEKLRLVLCGTGELADYIKDLAEKDKRILYKGQISPNESLKWVKAADVLVNPRRDDGEYTKYSFPSKDIEYLLSGNHVVAYQLAGMKKCYQNYIIKVCDDNLKDSILVALSLKKNANNDFLQYAKENLYNCSFIQKIIKVSF